VDVNDVSFDACLIYSFDLWVDFQMTDSLSIKFASIQELQHIDSNLLYALMGYTMNPALSEAALKCLETLPMKETRLICESVDDIDRAFRFALWFEKQHLVSLEHLPIDFSAIKARAAAINRPATESQFQRSVQHCLDQLEPGLWRSEVQCPETLYSMDLVKDRIVIEVDGPYHFIWDRKATFATIIKREILKLYGWTVKSVPFFEWNLLRSQSERVQYLSQLLESN
jgi:hypothetical protein